jgi:hypothetical protein
LYKPKVYLGEVRIEKENIVGEGSTTSFQNFYDSARITVDYLDQVTILPRSTSLQGAEISKVQINLDDEFSNWKEYPNNSPIVLDKLEEGDNRILLRGVNKQWK